MSLIATGSPLIPLTQWPSHCAPWSQTSEQMMDRGLFSNSICAAVMVSFSLSSRIISGILVLIGQPFRHLGLRHCRHFSASLSTLLILFLLGLLFKLIFKAQSGRQADSFLSFGGFWPIRFFLSILCTFLNPSYTRPVHHIASLTDSHDCAKSIRLRVKNE